jgi:TatD DNase family protein
MATKPTFVDIHAHTNFTAFDGDRKEVVERALRAGVWMINIGTQQDTSKKAVEMTREFPEGVYAIVGLHPVHVNPSYHDADELGEGAKTFTSRGETFDAAYYRKLITDAIAQGGKMKIVGIGECGLDYYRMPTEDEKKRQIEAFKGQIELALEFDLPLMLHIRSGIGGNAYKDALDMLKSYKTAAGDKLRGDAHFFAGSLEDAKGFLDLGFYLSYTGVVTFAKQYKELVEATPIDCIMSETDCPYVAPVPERGKRNEPSFVAHTADHIVGLKGLNVDEGRRHLVENAFRLWNL